MATVMIHFGDTHCTTALSGEELDKFLTRLQESFVGTITIEGSPQIVINLAQITMVAIT